MKKGGLRIEGKVARLEGFLVWHCFSTKEAGNMSLKYGEDAKENLFSFLFLVGAGQNRVHIKPEFGDRVLFVEKNDAGKTLECDGLITFSSRLVLSLCPADCAPVIVTNNRREFVALLHAGRKNLKEIIDSALNLIEREINLQSHQILVGIGPAIKSCCYPVDLGEVIVSHLLDKHGIPRNHIFAANVCTCCTKDEKGDYLFFSHKRSQITGEKEGRFIALVSL